MRIQQWANFPFNRPRQHGGNDNHNLVFPAPPDFIGQGLYAGFQRRVVKVRPFRWQSCNSLIARLVRGLDGDENDVGGLNQLRNVDDFNRAFFQRLLCTLFTVGDFAGANVRDHPCADVASNDGMPA